MSYEAMEVVSKIEDQFTSLDHTFLTLFGRQKSLHLLLRYPTDKLVMQEVVYHLSTRLLAVLQRKKKAPWNALPIQIGLYEIKNLKVTDTKGKAIEKFSLSHFDFNLYHPRNVYKDHCVRINFLWSSRTLRRLNEEAWNNCYNDSNSHEPVSFTGK